MVFLLMVLMINAVIEYKSNNKPKTTEHIELTGICNSTKGTWKGRYTARLYEISHNNSIMLLATLDTNEAMALAAPRAEFILKAIADLVKCLASAADQGQITPMQSAQCQRIYDDQIANFDKLQAPSVLIGEIAAGLTMDQSRLTLRMYDYEFIGEEKKPRIGSEAVAECIFSTLK